MTDPSVEYESWCGDLVSMRRLEPGLIRLFRDTPAGRWVSLKSLYATAGQSGPPNDVIAVTWLPEPGERTGYVVVCFCVPEYSWTMTAFYNLDRLMNATAGQDPDRGERPA